MAGAGILEMEVREWLKKEALGDLHVTWIEPSRGSSLGVPDALVAYRGVLWPLELKATKAAKNGLVAPIIRPVQKIWHRRMAIESIYTFIIVGVLWEDKKYIVMSSWCMFDSCGGNFMMPELLGRKGQMSDLRQKLFEAHVDRVVVGPCLIGQIGR